MTGGEEKAVTEPGKRPELNLWLGGRKEENSKKGNVFLADRDRGKEGAEERRKHRKLRLGRVKQADEQTGSQRGRVTDTATKGI